MSFNEELYLKVITKIVEKNYYPNFQSKNDTIKMAIKNNDFSTALQIINQNDNQNTKDNLLYLSLVKVAKIITLEKNLQNLLMPKLVEVYHNDIVILDTMDKEKTRLFLTLTKDIPELLSFTINVNQEERIVLQYNFSNPLWKVKKLKQLADVYYNTNQYGAYINISRVLMPMLSKDFSFYLKTGLAYLKINNLEQAIKYLTIASALNKNLKLASFLNKLQQRLDEQQEIEAMPEIYEVVHQLSLGMDFKDICFGLGLNESQIIYFKNILIREYESLNNQNFEYYSKLALMLNDLTL